MQVNVNRLTKDEAILYRLVKEKNRVYHGTLNNYGIGLKEARFIMENSFGKMLVRNKMGSYDIVDKSLKKFRGLDRLPCMVLRSEINNCAHAETCYLSFKCEAVPKH